ARRRLQPRIIIFLASRTLPTRVNSAVPSSRAPRHAGVRLGFTKAQLAFSAGAVFRETAGIPIPGGLVNRVAVERAGRRNGPSRPDGGSPACARPGAVDGIHRGAGPLVVFGQTA